MGKNEIYAGAGDQVVDQIYVPADGTQSQGKGNPGGVNADILSSFRIDDRIFIHSNSEALCELSCAAVEFDQHSGMGVYLGGVLEALVVGDFSVDQIGGMTWSGYYT